VGKILVRKLLLRGYPVTVLAKPDSTGVKSFPKAVTVVKGDVGEYSDLRLAMQGISKVPPTPHPPEVHGISPHSIPKDLSVFYFLSPRISCSRSACRAPIQTTIDYMGYPLPHTHTHMMIRAG
jgi:hypothetical protein